MDIEKVFSDLESNQAHENEEAKKKLVELFTQTKEQWAVQYMLEYFIKTGSKRIMEVLVKAQTPHDGYIFDRLDEWLKTQQYRVQALNVFCFIVRRHPTWLYKIEKHRLIKSVFKLLTHEKDIVPLMSALLCIITLLPIIPNSVPNFLNDLFDVFGHLASWKLQNTNRLPEEKLVHLQVGLQMLFHRLYGMYPCNFLGYLTDFIKKDKGGGIFQHTIKPLLDTVRVHPMLLTATTETEVSNTRWKEMEPHDVVMECAHLSLPVVHPDFCNDDNTSTYPITPGSMLCGTPCYSRMTSTNSNSEYSNSTYQLKLLPQARDFIACIDNNSSQLWSPHNEITAATSAIPLTPTAQFILPLPTSSNSQLLGVTGSSPPEAAVEATPETTPMKDFKQQHGMGAALANPHAVRAIFGNSQPSSPMRKDQQQNQFSFPDISTDLTNIVAGSTITTTSTTVTTRVTTTYDRQLQQVLQDRHAQTPFHPIETRSSRPEEQHHNQRSMIFPNSMPEMNTEMLLTATTAGNNQQLTMQTTMGTGMATTIESKDLTTGCGECNETERNMCTSGGLHMPTQGVMRRLAKKVNRRNRMASDCYNDYHCEPFNSSASKRGAATAQDQKKLRRTQSCPAFNNLFDDDDEADCPTHNGTTTVTMTDAQTNKTGSRLQRSGKILAMAMAPKIIQPIRYANAGTQTLEMEPSSNYEISLFELLSDCNEKRNKYEKNRLYPQDILDQYIMRSIHTTKDSFDAEQQQLMALELQYESYRRGIHAERNRRLMGRSRDKRSLEMERDRLLEQLKNFGAKNKELQLKMDNAIKLSAERQNIYNEELADLKVKYQQELEQKKCLRQANDALQTRLNAELSERKEVNYELQAMRGQIFNLNTELQHAQQQAEVGMQCKQELSRLEAEFIIMGEVQVRCRDRLAEIENYRSRDEELQMLQESYNKEISDLRHCLDEKTSQIESTKHRTIELQTQLVNSEKVIKEQKRLLRAVKEEYEEMFKSLNKKYDTQKKIIIQMEEKLMMSLHQPQSGAGHNTCSPDTDRTDIASSMDRNSPLSTSLASSESLSASLRSTELKNLQQLVETPSIPEVMSTMAANTYEDNTRLPAVDLASSATTANAINIMHSTATVSLPHAQELPTTSNTHAHPHLHLQ
ncbi:hamartin [Scaptodrosophila lebanonensis]|uniref:Hamartin n=1 Tax=Drosophila lebanonensis TaxID=7225 RepID=A0A6J2T0Q4_DROLE|nr:hamartin [Scaptodrosophila lebanonensis]